MKKMSILVVTMMALALAGCSKKTGDATTPTGPAAAGPEADCDKAVSNGMALGKDDLPSSDAKMMAQLHDLGVKHCVADNWSADVVKCMIDAKAKADSTACYGKLTPDQQQKMNQDAMAAGNGSGSAAAPN